jgi:hypothetical protein
MVSVEGLGICVFLCSVDWLVQEWGAAAEKIRVLGSIKGLCALHDLLLLCCYIPLAFISSPSLLVTLPQQPPSLVECNDLDPPLSRKGTPKCKSPRHLILWLIKLECQHTFLFIHTTEACTECPEFGLPFHFWICNNTFFFHATQISSKGRPFPWLAK